MVYAYVWEYWVWEVSVMKNLRHLPLRKLSVSYDFMRVRGVY